MLPPDYFGGVAEIRAALKRELAAALERRS